MFHIKRTKKYDFRILDFYIYNIYNIGNMYYEILYLLPDYNNLYSLMLTNHKANGPIHINVQHIVHTF